MEYMQRAVEMNIELSAEFVYMAATLIHIKSKMLLPRDPELEKMMRRTIRARNWRSGCSNTSALKTPRRCCIRSA